MSYIQIDRSASDTTLRVAPGDELRLELPETRTGGYKWESASPETDVFRIKDEGFERAPEVGGTGHHRWTVTAVKKGSARLEMDYRRSWEPPPGKQQFTLTIVVG
jgi:predicted secreted protein